MNVLVVDDSLQIRKGLVSVFTALSPMINVKEAQNGKQALKCMTTDHFEFIITDLEMEGGSGDVFIKHLQTSKVLKSKPIFIYSSTPYQETDADNIFYFDKNLVSLFELGNIIKEFIFKYKVCPNCDEAINRETCNNICFYTEIDARWREKISKYLK